jgi:hypothetical protein
MGASGPITPPGRGSVLFRSGTEAGLGSPGDNDMKHAATRALFAYWDRLRGERCAPERSEIDPTAIRGILADTFVIEVDDERRCPFRIAGTRVSALLGKELKGESFTALWSGPDRDEGGALVDVIVNESAPAVASVVAWTRDGAAYDLELLLLPLRHRGRTHARILGSLSPLAVPPRLGLDPVARLELRSERMIYSAERLDSPGLPSPRQALAFGRPERRGHLFVLRGGKDVDSPDALKRR